MFFIAVIVLGLLSILLAVLALRKEVSKLEHEKAKEVKKSLKKGRVLFYSPSSSSSKS